MRYYYLSMIVLMIQFLGCSPKVVEKEVVEDKTVEEVVKDEPLTTCVTFSNLSPRDRDMAEKAYVLYRDLAKAKKYEKALPLWKSAFALAPAADGNIRYHFDDGVAIYKYMYEIASDDSKASYVDTIMGIYDKRVECFPEEKSYVDGRKAFDYYYTFNNYIGDDELFNLFKSVIDAKGEHTDYFVINPFTKMLHDRVVEDKIEYSEGRIYAKRIADAIGYGSSHCKGTECEAWDVINGYAPDRLEALEGIKGFYNCDYYTEKYYPVYVDDSENCETIQTVYARLVRGGCMDTDAHLIEVKSKYNSLCRKKNPTAGVLKEAYNSYTSGEYENAINKFVEFIDKTDDVDKKAKYLMVVAKIYYRDLKNYPKSRSYARRAAKLKDNWGEPYMLIGKLYASSGPLCGPGTGFKSQVVTWPAIDKFNRAKSIDPSVSDEANELIRKYSQYMPSKGDIFQRSITAGSSYKVECWIQEKTTVRTAN